MSNPDYVEKAVDIWCEQFFEDHGREPTDDEVNANVEVAVRNYIDSVSDAFYESMREDGWR